MIELGQHWEFVATSYIGAGLLVGALVLWTAFDAHRARARVRALEAARGDK